MEERMLNQMNKQQQQLPQGQQTSNQGDQLSKEQQAGMTQEPPMLGQNM